MNATNEAGLPIMAARERLAVMGWIPPRSEYFHHVPPPAADVWLGEAEGAASAAAPAADARDGWQLDIADDASRARVDVQWLDAADPAQRKTLFRDTRAPGDSHQDRFVWAHRALCQHGLRLQVGSGHAAAADAAAAPVRLALHRSALARVEAPTLIVDVAPGTQCVLMETHDSGSVDALAQNLQIHVRVGRGARMQHLRIVTPQADSRMAHQIHVDVAGHGRYDQILIGNGSSYHQQRTELTLGSAAAQAYTGAALCISGQNTLDQQVEALHGAERTLSDMQTLMLGSGRARGAVNIMTRMGRGVRDARTVQMMRGIPTGGGQPRITLRPHMEICHDAVEAEHGATWGSLPEDALFYARQRGLSEQTARALIVQGMLRAQLAHVLDDDMDLIALLGLEQYLETAVSTHLAAETRKAGAAA